MDRDRADDYRRGLAIAVLLIGAPGRAWGRATVALFALLAALTAVSISWSVQPNNSWIEAGRTLSYLAVFAGGAALARLLPARWAGVVGGLALLATVLSAYALLVKVFPPRSTRTTSSAGSRRRSSTGMRPG